MATSYTVKKIKFPSREPQDLAKLKKFLSTTSEFMEVSIRIVEVTTVEAQIDAERVDVATILSKVAANETRKQKAAQAG